AWVGTRAMGAAREQHTATVLADGRLLVAGGLQVSGTNVNVLNGVELYDPASGAWTNAAPLATGRAVHTATALANGVVLVAGGDAAASTSPSSPQAVADLVDPDGRGATRANNMSTVRADHTATALPDGRVLVVGGTLDKPQAEVFAPGTGRWTATAPPAA